MFELFHPLSEEESVSSPRSNRSFKESGELVKMKAYGVIVYFLSCCEKFLKVN